MNRFFFWNFHQFFKQTLQHMETIIIKNWWFLFVYFIDYNRNNSKNLRMGSVSTSNNATRNSIKKIFVKTKSVRKYWKNTLEKLKVPQIVVHLCDNSTPYNESKWIVKTRFSKKICKIQPISQCHRTPKKTTIKRLFLLKSTIQPKLYSCVKGILFVLSLHRLKTSLNNSNVKNATKYSPTNL